MFHRFIVQIFYFTTHILLVSAFGVLIGDVGVEHIGVFEVFFLAELLIDPASCGDVRVPHELLGDLIRNARVKKV